MYFLITFANKNIVYLCSKKTVQLIESKKDLACELVASWSVQVGDLDQCIHLWRYTGGFEKVDLAEQELKKDPVSYKIINCRHFLTSKFFILGLHEIGKRAWRTAKSKASPVSSRFQLLASYGATTGE